MRDFNRRGVIGLVGGAAAWPLAARAQQGKRPTIGFLGSNASVWAPYIAAFVERLRTLGWIEGRTIAIEYRWHEGRPDENDHDYVRSRCVRRLWLRPHFYSLRLSR